MAAQYCPLRLSSPLTLNITPQVYFSNVSTSTSAFISQSLTNSISSSICEIPASPPPCFTLRPPCNFSPYSQPFISSLLWVGGGICVCMSVCVCVCVWLSTCLQSGWSPAVGAVNHIAGRWDQDVQRTHSTYLVLCRYERCKQVCVNVCVRTCICLAVCECMMRLWDWRCVW